MRDFNDFLDFLATNHDDIIESVSSRSEKYMTENPHSTVSFDRLDMHYEMLEVLQRYHEWLHQDQ